MAPSRLPDWRAASRALALERGAANVGPISPHTLDELAHRNIHALAPDRKSLQCTEEDLDHAGLVIALKEREHRPILAQRFPAWPDRVTYWHIHDIDLDHPNNALAKIASNVEPLIDELELRA